MGVALTIITSPCKVDGGELVSKQLPVGQTTLSTLNASILD